MAVNPETFDAIILGSGQAGNPLAAALAKAGKTVAIIESKHVGGTCVNEGCTPTKTMIASAHVVSLARRAAEFGVHVGPVSVDMAAVCARKRKVVDIWRSGSEKSLDAPGITLIRGLGSFSGMKTVSVALTDGGTRELTAEWIFVNTGLSSLVPDVAGIADIPYLTNETVMELDQVPEHLLILGGSYIAVEFAQMFRRFGAEVSIVSHAEQLLPKEDPDVAEEFAKIFAEDGINVVLGAKVKSALQYGTGIGLIAEAASGEQIKLSGSHLLLAAGRKPNTDALALGKTGLQVDEHGFLPANERLETVVPGIYALGDVKGGPAFTHVSYDDYRIINSNLLEGGARTTKDRLLVYTVFTDPELGRVGLSETEARKQGRSIRVAKMPASSIARAFETGEDRGLVKVVVDADTELILGAAILAGEGGEIMSVLEVAMMGGLRFTALRDAVFAHPGWAEGLNTVFTRWQE
jgi:pyruvate/2-oxoglutarate dehydrogenase complex dihydrolipoamide dehydrogenase (E3) component